MAKILASVLAVFGLLTFFSFEGRALNLITFSLALLLIWLKKTKKILTLLFFSLLFAQILIVGQVEGGSIRRQLATPLGQEYTTDMRGFLKTYQLMEKGQNFYPAFVSGMAGLRSGQFHPDINAWRQPFLFYFWKAFPGNGEMIYFLWQIVIAFDLIAAFLIARKFLPENFAILSPFILWPYFHFSLVDLTILQPEWWAMSFFLFGLTSCLYKKYLVAGIFLALSLANRELFIIPILFLIFQKRKFWKNFLPGLTVFLAYYLFYHLPNIFQFPTEILRGNRHGGFYVLHSFFAYSSWSYFLGQWRPFLIILGLSLLGFRKKPKAILLATFLPFLVFAMAAGTLGIIDETRDYWGIYFVPLLLVSAPGLILPPEKYEKTL